tara:strand:+ start:108 stop:278 length:171 start_codon:yes stop_codon:yes gene_type:complete
MPGSHKQNSMFKKTEGSFFQQNKNPFPITSCGRRRNLGQKLPGISPLHKEKKYGTR